MTIKNLKCVFSDYGMDDQSAQRLAVMDKFKKKIQEQAKEKMSEGGGDKKSNNYKNRVSPNGVMMMKKILI